MLPLAFPDEVPGEVAICAQYMPPQPEILHIPPRQFLLLFGKYHDILVEDDETRLSVRLWSEQIAAAWLSVEGFLTELTLDPPDAIGDHAGVPLMVAAIATGRDQIAGRRASGPGRHPDRKRNRKPGRRERKTGGRAVTWPPSHFFSARTLPVRRRGRHTGTGTG